MHGTCNEKFRLSLRTPGGRGVTIRIESQQTAGCKFSRRRAATLPFIINPIFPVSFRPVFPSFGRSATISQTACVSCPARCISQVPVRILIFGILSAFSARTPQILK
jgi:hypothetical protein